MLELNLVRGLGKLKFSFNFILIFLTSGTEILAALTPSILNTSEKAIGRFTPDERDCYLDSEFKFPNLLWENGYRLYRSMKESKLLP